MATTTRKKINVRLPNKLHAMLTKALDDVESLEKNPKYKINMELWAFRPKVGAACQLCLAGSQLVGYLPKGECNIRPKGWVFGGQSVLTDLLSRKLEAINSLRNGDVAGALNDLNGAVCGTSIYIDHHELDREVSNYKENRRLWKAQMRLLAEELRLANI